MTTWNIPTTSWTALCEHVGRWNRITAVKPTSFALAAPATTIRVSLRIDAAGRESIEIVAELGRGVRVGGAAADLSVGDLCMVDGVLCIRERQSLALMTPAMLDFVIEEMIAAASRMRRAASRSFSAQMRAAA